MNEGGRDDGACSLSGRVKEQKGYVCKSTEKIMGNMGMDGKDKLLFSHGMAHLLLYRTMFGNMDVPEDYMAERSFPLGKFVWKMRKMYREGRLEKKYEKRLLSIGFSFDRDMQAWESVYRIAEDYAERHGCLPDMGYRTDDGILLGAWIRRQMVVYDALTEEQKGKLARIGIGE